MGFNQDFKEQYKALGNVYYFGNEAPFTDSYASFDNSFGIDGGAAFESSMGKYFFDQSKTGHQFNGKYEVSFWVESSFNRLALPGSFARCCTNARSPSILRCPASTKSFTFEAFL